VNLTVAQLLQAGTLPVQIGAAVRYRAESPVLGPGSFGLRALVTF
jgi:hypothetical protein